MAYPYSKAETLADGAVHALGLALSVLASIFLLWQADTSGAPLWPLALYCGCLIAAFAISAAYHLSPVDRFRPLLNRIDHAAIFLKIAGTYTALAVLIGTGFAYAVLGLVWALAVIGAVAKLWFWAPNARYSLTLYLALGWLSVLLIGPMLAHLPAPAVALIGLGGLVYTLGTIIFARDAMRYQNAIWHVFVLVASSCFFAAISLSL